MQGVKSKDGVDADSDAPEVEAAEHFESVNRPVDRSAFVDKFK